jgi:hypothetical protein
MTSILAKDKYVVTGKDCKMSIKREEVWLVLSRKFRSFFTLEIISCQFWYTPFNFNIVKCLKRSSQELMASSQPM